ncbi:hypothetical protein AB0L70_35750 [Kribbella sp. NPDC051952]|uniref:hypothetical protein n=1 Tax=Kribbella sp. NPDC051952 TaxID=3154851 RepID=UPI00341FB2B9
MRSRLLAAGVLVTALAVVGCDPGSSTKKPTTTPPSPTEAPTAMLASNVDVIIRPPRGQLSPQQQQILAVYSKLINARYRFYSHPLIIDPEFARGVLPTSPFAPTEPDTIGLIGPVPIDGLSITLTTTNQATVDTCEDRRALRYLGRDGAIDITGPAGDRLRGDVGRESVEFEKTTAPAADGAKATTPRWLASSGGSSAGTPECKALASTSPPSSTPRAPITATP